MSPKLIFLENTEFYNVPAQVLVTCSEETQRRIHLIHSKVTTQLS
jgi:hypothetical protein